MRTQGDEFDQMIAEVVDLPGAAIEVELRAALGDRRDDRAELEAIVSKAALMCRRAGRPFSEQLREALGEVGCGSGEPSDLAAVSPVESDMRDGALRRVRARLASLVGHDRTLAREAGLALLAQWRSNNVGFATIVREILHRPSASLKAALAGADGESVVVRAYRDVDQPLAGSEILDWLRAPSSQVYSLLDQPELGIAIVTVAPVDRRFVAAWLQFSETEHVLCVNEESGEDERLRSVFHELEHLVKFLCPEINMRHRDISQLTAGRDRGLHVASDLEATSGGAPLILFALAQRQVDPDDKDLAAEWVATDLPLTNGAGIFVDAGSQCMAVWKAIVGQIEKNQFANLAVVTNSLLVLQDWPDSLTKIPQLQGTTVEPAGEIFDAPHLAFYGEAVRTKLTSPHFRPSAVYIGASGIEFDEQAGILLGYHAGEPERASKELLFQCSCKDARVILATPKKIGNPGGRVFDILSVKGLDPKAPIYLVSAEPKADSVEERQQFEAAKRVLQGETMVSKLREKGLTFHWITLDRESRDVPKVKEHMIVPRRV